MLNRNNINFELLPCTNNIWAVDFMPIQISEHRFIQFNYKPDYLNAYPEDIPSVDKIVGKINKYKWSISKSDLRLDGGNISCIDGKIIMCDKVFSENKFIPEKQLICQLKNSLEIDSLIFVPWNKYDFTGHVDGMARFVNCNTVLINDYSKENPRYQRAFRMSLQNAGIDWIELPYFPANDPTLTSAKGLYLNYLQMKQAIVAPIFGSSADEKAMRILEDTFKGQNILPIEANEIAKSGGLLNCISWNIVKNDN